MTPVDLDAKLAEIPQVHLNDLKRAVACLNNTVAELIERHGEHYEIRMWTRVREEEPPRVEVSITRVFARFT